MSSFEALLPFDMTLEQFKKEGLTTLGEPMHNDIAHNIRSAARQIGEQLLVTGWGHTPASAMLYEIGAYGDYNHSYSGTAAIGSGGPTAQSSLLILGQSRDRTLSETIFNVAMAKFASEKSGGLTVGQKTAMYVSRKAVEGDPRQFHAEPLLEEEISQLRNVWDEHVRPKMPLEGCLVSNRISQRIKGSVEISDVVDVLKRSIRVDPQTRAE